MKTKVLIPQVLSFLQAVRHLQPNVLGNFFPGVVGHLAVFVMQIRQIVQVLLLLHLLNPVLFYLVHVFSLLKNNRTPTLKKWGYDRRAKPEKPKYWKWSASLAFFRGAHQVMA